MDEKVKLYEDFLNERLANDLDGVLKTREVIYTEIAEYHQLRNVIEKTTQFDMKTSTGGLKTLVDIGANFYIEALVPDASVVIISIGMGLYLEMTTDKALEFIVTRTKLLDGKCSSLTQEAAYIRAQMKLVLEGLRELQLLPDDKRKPHQGMW